MRQFVTRPGSFVHHSTQGYSKRFHCSVAVGCCFGEILKFHFTEISLLLFKFLCHKLSSPPAPSFRLLCARPLLHAHTPGRKRRHSIKPFPLSSGHVHALQFSVSLIKWNGFPDTVSHYHGDRWGFKKRLPHVMKSMKAHYIRLDKSSHAAFLTRKGSFNEKTSSSRCTRLGLPCYE